MERLFNLAPEMKEHNISLILIQIDEAHSDAWPMAIDSLLGVDAVKPQQCFQDRVDRAKYFVDKYKPPFDVYVDGWNNQFAELFRAWPDKYYCVTKDLKVIGKSEYNKEGSKEATVVVDVTDFIKKLMK
jgi:hypothetical protein